MEKFKKPTDSVGCIYFLWKPETKTNNNILDEAYRNGIVEKYRENKNLENVEVL